ncbi:MAG TPA: serine--tRNA ligase [Candidatus Krumholzibacteria bacterium]|nr:serine--tRNA ligase [Candidatus Krumholzibacteria bacterium]
MIERRLIRENPDRVREGLARRHANVDVERLVALDAEHLANLQRSEELKRERNTASETIGRRKQAGEDIADLHAAMKETSAAIKSLEARNKEIEETLDALLLTVPNLPHASTPDGADAADNVVVRTVGKAEKPFADVLPHWEIGEKLGILDLEGGRVISGRGFIVFRREGALLCRALINLMLDMHAEQGYEELLVPYLVHRDSMTGTGQLPKYEEDMYHCPADDLFLVPTAEVPVTNLHRESIVERERLPIRYTAYSPCFRREAGSHGADTRGLLRVHQFDKVEMVKFVHPDTSYDELETLAADATAVLDALELPYRVLQLCAGDLGFAAAKCYDLETFAPGVDRWLEVSSCSNFEDFQARRAGIRLKKADTDKHKFVHTLNGSGLALPRVVASILEVHQTPTGRVRIPGRLRPYMRGREYLG